MSKHPDGNKGSRNRETLRALAYFSQIGITMAASVLVGVLMGKYLDTLLGTSPWLVLIFSLLGVGAAIKAMFNIPKDEK
ncbi:MAG: AtpZ/AtpI family protein [Tepidanaerobacteraceae bacterium]